MLLDSNCFLFSLLKVPLQWTSLRYYFCVCTWFYLKQILRSRTSESKAMCDLKFIWNKMTIFFQNTLLIDFYLLAYVTKIMVFNFVPILTHGHILHMQGMTNYKCVPIPHYFVSPFKKEALVLKWGWLITRESWIYCTLKENNTCQLQ